MCCTTTLLLHALCKCEKYDIEICNDIELSFGNLIFAKFPIDGKSKLYPFEKKRNVGLKYTKTKLSQKSKFFESGNPFLEAMRSNLD